jgi:hypothetical protein
LFGERDCFEQHTTLVHQQGALFHAAVIVSGVFVTF